MEEIIVRLIPLVVEPSKFLYPKLSSAADYLPLDFPAIHPVYTWQQGYTSFNIKFTKSANGLHIHSYLFLQ